MVDALRSSVQGDVELGELVEVYPGCAVDSDGVLHMAGIPAWMAIAGVVVIIIVSHLFLSKKRDALIERPRYWRFNVLSLPFLKALVKKQYFPMLLQGASIVAMLLVIGAGFWGTQRAGMNIGPIITWTWWWALLIFMVLGFGTAFCSICPWEGLSSLITSLSFSSRKKALGSDRAWPKWMRNIFPALLLFILLTWIELGLDITQSPMITAVLATMFVSMVILAALFYDRRGFCRYACLVGRITGIYALFAPVEVRSISTDACKSCTTKDCIKGNDESVGCPTNLFPSKLQENTYCTMCTECIRSCPHDNMTINIRPPATDLMSKFKFRADEAILAITLLALTSFHGITMTPMWDTTNNWLRAEFGLTSIPLFTFLMLVAVIVPIGIFMLSARMARTLSGSTENSTKQIFIAYAYAVLPVALFYHLAHNSMHFFMEAQHIIPVLSDPFGWGWNIFSTASKTYDPLLPMTVVWWMQLVFIVIGHIYGVVIADRIAKRLYAEHKQALRSLIPMLVVMIVYSIYSVWLISQPMIMRTGM